MKNLIYFIIFSIFFACNNDDNADSTTVEYNARVLGRGMDCGDAFLIQLDARHEIPENPFGDIFYEINLPNEYKVEGLEISVSFREPTVDEIPVCTHMGPGYPHLFITEVSH
ncbi:MAG: hypothetical protein Q4G27_11155 [Flavobacteriaceae bacterium]|nr:hypothetical protein [Flavobacteriaceae bacterium]